MAYCAQVFWGSGCWKGSRYGGRHHCPFTHSHSIHVCPCGEAVNNKGERTTQEGKRIR